jgi:DeoR/GlpR family transcriptional regulator of sugar metabolism
MQNDDLRYAEERYKRILETLHANERVEVSALANLFSVSTQTVRRDLAEMEKRRLLKRTHGGAVLPHHLARYDATLTERAGQQTDEKRQIGQVASTLIQDGETIMLDAGTTTLQVARHLYGKRNLTVVTNALGVCTALSDAPHLDLVVPGGEYLRSNHSLVGSMAEEAIRQFNFDRAVLGTSAIDLVRGVLCMPNLPEARLQKAIAAVTRSIIVVADHTKFDHSAFAVSVPLDHIDIIVTDEAIQPDHIAALEAYALTVITA